MKAERDMDSQMLVGCTGFVAASFSAYFLSIWPFLVWISIEQIHVLALTLAAGTVPPLILGAVVSRKAGLAGAAGFVGGMLAASIFLYLRFEQLFMEALARRIPEPEYPQALQYMIPSATIIATVLVALVFVDRKTIGLETDDKP